MKTYRLLALAALLAGSAAANAGDFSYDYIEGTFGETEADGDILGFGGSVSLDKQFGLVGGLGIVDFDGGDGMVLRGGGLFHTPIQKNLDFVGTLELVYSDWEVDAGPFNAKWSDDDLGLAASGGVRFQVQDNFELEGRLTLTEVDPFDDGLGLYATARYYMNKQFSASAGVAADAVYDGLFINLRYDLK